MFSTMCTKQRKGRKTKAGGGGGEAVGLKPELKAT